MTEGGVSMSESGSTRLVVEGIESMNECVERLFLSCRNTLLVRAPRLDLDFYFTSSFTESCESIVTRDLRNELGFLVEDERHVMRANSRLISLARRFTSYVKIRVIPEEYIDQREMFVVSDGTGYLHQPNPDRYRGVMDASDPGRGRRLALGFKELWERSQPPAELFTTGL